MSAGCVFVELKVLLCLAHWTLGPQKRSMMTGEEVGNSYELEKGNL